MSAEMKASTNESQKFLGAFLDGADRAADVAADSSLVETLEAALVRAHAAWPELVFDSERFARHLGARAPRSEALDQWLGKAPLEDLSLSFCCAQGDPLALAALDRTHGPALKAALGRTGGNSAEVPELLQLLRQRLLVGTATEPPRIAGYSGRGPLAGWLQVAAVRVALGERRKRHARADVQEHADLMSRVPLGVELPEAAYLKSRYRSEFEEALRKSFAVLAPSERTLLRFHYVDGLGVEKLGKVLGVHASTISRRIARARSEVLRDTRSRLEVALHLSPHELDSLLRVVRSALSLSISRALPPG